MGYNSPVMKKLIVLAVVAALAAAGFYYGGEYANLEFVKRQQSAVAAYYDANPVLLLGGFFAAYVAVTGLSLPGAALMTLLAGAIFGVVVGTILVSFASSLGATLAFLVARFVLGDSLQKKYGDKLQKINDGVKREGKFYLFTMRLIPAFPFFLINILMGLTPIRAWEFYWVSQLGMLAGTVVYVNAGTQLAKIDSLGGILSPALIASFVALGLFPLIAKKAIEFIKKKKGNAPPPPAAA